VAIVWIAPRMIARLAPGATGADGEPDPARSPGPPRR
jgi:hypothetical protein